MAPLFDPLSSHVCHLCARGVYCGQCVGPREMERPEPLCLSRSPLRHALEGHRFAVVEDDPLMRQMLCEVLESGGARFEEYKDGLSALEGMRAAPPTAALLDLWLPRMDGFTLCRALRAEPSTRGCTLVIITGSCEESTHVFGREVGADDFILKPFHLPTFMDRLASVLTRSAPQARTETLDFGALVVDGPRQQARVDGRVLALTPTGFAILYLLAHEPGRVRSAPELLGDGIPTDELPQVALHLRALHLELGALRECVQVVAGHEYRFVAP